MAVEGVYTYDVTPIDAERGKTFSTRIEFYSGTYGSNPLAVDQSAFSMTVKDGEKVILSFAMGEGIERTAKHILHLYKSAVEMNFTGVFDYELVQTLTNGTINLICQGKFTIA